MSEKFSMLPTWCYAEHLRRHFPSGTQEQGSLSLSLFLTDIVTQLQGNQHLEGLTTMVEKTKSSSYKPQYGREDMSPTTAAPTPMICSAIQPSCCHKPL